VHNHHLLPREPLPAVAVTHHSCARGKALTVLAHKLARTVYHQWKHDQATFLAT